MRRRVEWFQRRYLSLRNWSQHSFVLLIGGMSFIAIGMSVGLYTPGTPRWEALILARHVMSLEHWTNVFIFVGIGALLAARWPRHSYVWGYMLLTGVSAGWSMFYFAGAFFVSEPLHNLPPGAFWAFYGTMWWAISGLSNPPWASGGKRGRS